MNRKRLYPSRSYGSRPGYRFCLGKCDKSTPHSKKEIHTDVYNEDYFEVICLCCSSKRNVCA